MTYQKVGVIGAGVMGVGLSTDLLLHGIDVVLIDNNERQLEKAKEEIVKSVRFAPLLNREFSTLSKEEICQKMTFSDNHQALADCEFVVENVTEDWLIKKKLYAEIDQVLPPETCIGMNTSCTSITLAGSVTSRPDKIVGVHFMNPVHLKKTVEVIKGYHTSEEAIGQLHVLLDQLGKDSVIVNDFPGFVSNRISHLFMNEAAFVVQDQVADPAQVDKIFKECFSHKMGPLETADLIGLDTVVDSLKVLYDSFQDPKFRCCPLLKKMVHAGHLGRKTNKGFYDYT